MLTSLGGGGVDFAAYIHRCAARHLAMSDDGSAPVFQELPMCWRYGPVFSSVFTHQKEKKEDFSEQHS